MGGRMRECQRHTTRQNCREQKRQKETVEEMLNYEMFEIQRGNNNKKKVALTATVTNEFVSF